MKGYMDITVRYLKSNKKRALLTIFAIVLSITLLCSEGIMGESLQNTMLQNVKEYYGFFHESIIGIDETQIKALESNIKIEAVGYKLDAAIVRILKGQTLMITGCNKTVMDMQNTVLSSGRLPMNDNEIVIEEWTLDNMKVKPAIGDTLPLDLSILNGQEITKDYVPQATVKRNFNIK